MRIKNWQKFQHYKERKPPWVKLYRELLDDIEWNQLPGDAAKTLIMLWLVASEDDGHLPDIKTLCFRLRVPEKSFNDSISMLSHWLEHDDSDVQATRKQGAELETETERETEEEIETKRETEEEKDVAVPNRGTADPVSLKPKKEPNQFWPVLIEHIKRKWEYKKRPHGKFTMDGKDAQHLQRKFRVYDPFTLMGLYDDFIVNDDQFWSKNGHKVWVFCGAIDFLIDKPTWKSKADKYRAEHLTPRTTEEKANAAQLSDVLKSMTEKKFSTSIEKIRKENAHIGSI